MAIRPYYKPGFFGCLLNLFVGCVSRPKKLYFYRDLPIRRNAPIFSKQGALRRE